MVGTSVGVSSCLSVFVCRVDELQGLSISDLGAGLGLSSRTLQGVGIEELLRPMRFLLQY